MNIIKVIMNHTNKRNEFIMPECIPQSLIQYTIELCELLNIRIISKPIRRYEYKDYYSEISLNEAYKELWIRLTLRDGTIYPKCRVYGCQNGTIELKSAKKRKSDKTLIYKTVVIKCELISRIKVKVK